MTSIALTAALEHIGVIDDKQSALLLLDGHLSDAGNLLHSKLGERLASLLLLPVQLPRVGAIFLSIILVVLVLLVLGLILL